MRNIKWLIFIILLIPALSFASGEKGIFANGSLQTKTATLSASSATDTLNGFTVALIGASNLGGDLIVVIKSTLNSGAYTICTVSVRKYYDADLGYGSWFNVGTFSSDGTHEFNVVSYSGWFYTLGYQIRITAASGTFNITLIGKAFNR